MPEAQSSAAPLKNSPELLDSVAWYQTRLIHHSRAVGTVAGASMRRSPNVIITGTPGVGKTVHCEKLAQEVGLRHLSINQVAKDRGCFESYDQDLETWIVDEDKVRR